MNTGKSGAKRSTYSGASPRELLVRTIEACGERANEDIVFSAFEKALADNDRCLVAIKRWWFDNNYRSLTSEVETGKRPKPQAAESEPTGSTPTESTPAAPARPTVKSAIKNFSEDRVTEVLKRNTAKIALREMLLPNNKKLKDCTFGELRKLAPTLSEWISSVASRGKKDQIVGRVLSEADLQELYNLAS